MLNLIIINELLDSMFLCGNFLKFFVIKKYFQKGQLKLLKFGNINN